MSGVGGKVVGNSQNLASHSIDLNGFFDELFIHLDLAGYCWSPVVPDLLVKYREEQAKFCKLQEFFGLGVKVGRQFLISAGLSEDLIEKAAQLQLAVSRPGRYFVPHNHWHSRLGSSDEYVYFGRESLLFIYQLYRHWKSLKNMRILDIGCSAGSLSLELGQVAELVLGVDRSAKAIQWAIASASVQNVRNATFLHFDVNCLNTTESFLSQSWDVAVFNPPMLVARKSHLLPYRDGGEFGIEVPLHFLDFAQHCLRPFGEVYCLMTSPIIDGQSRLFEEIARRDWTLLEKVCINERYNHHMYGEEEYLENGISRIELYFIYMRKNY